MVASSPIPPESPHCRILRYYDEFDELREQMINIICEELGYDRFGIGVTKQKARRVIGVMSVDSDQPERCMRTRSGTTDSCCN